jgi:DNA-binding NarL/FixJ family response regulator
MTKRLVIIDDEETCRILYTHLLRNIPGVKIIAEFENAEQALVQIPEMKVDIVIVDYVLPGMSGIECAERLQKFPEIKVLLVTGHESGYINSKLNGSQNFEVIQKDWSKRGLDRIAEICKNTTAIAPS